MYFCVMEKSTPVLCSVYLDLPIKVFKCFVSREPNPLCLLSQKFITGTRQVLQIARKSMKKITPPFLFIICIVIMAGLWWMLPLVRFVPFPINLLGVLVFAVGLGIAKRGSDVFEKEGTNIETFNNPDRLVTDGLFRISRNPMYLGFLTALVGMAVMLGNLSSFLVAFVFFIVTDRWYITFEEDAMAKAFGERYAEYKAKTRRWL